MKNKNYLGKSLTGFLWFVISRTRYKSLLNEIKQLADAVWDLYIPRIGAPFAEATGDQKRARVKAELKDLEGELGEFIKQTAGMVINLLIELAVAYIFARKS